MTVATVNVTGTVQDAGEHPIAGAKIVAQLTANLTDGAILYAAADPLTTTSAADGTWSLAVIPNDSTLTPSGSAWSFTITVGTISILSRLVVVSTSNFPSVPLMTLVNLSSLPPIGTQYVSGIIAGTGVTISPANGVGQVTVNSSGGGGGLTSLTSPDSSIAVAGTLSAPQIEVASSIQAAVAAATSVGVAARAGLAPLSTAAGVSTLAYPTQPTISGDSKVWQRVFWEDFLGSSIDTTKWYLSNGDTGQNGVTTVGTNVVVANSIASFILSDSTHGAMIRGQNSNNGGADNSVSIPQGAYIEWYCFLPNNGTEPYNWTGPWTSSGDFYTGAGYQEIDMLETFNAATYNYHTQSGQAGPVTISTTNYTGAWHKYGALLGPGSLVTYYIDGTLMGTLATDGSQLTQVLRFTHGWQSGFPQGIGSSFAAQVDWVGVWVPATWQWPTRAASPLTRTLAVSGSIIPSPRFASLYDYGVGGAISMQNPANFSASSPPIATGDRLSFCFRQGGTGFAVTFAGSLYKTISGFSIPTTANTVSYVTFEYDGSFWRQVTPVVTVAA